MTEMTHFVVHNKVLINLLLWPAKPNFPPYEACELYLVKMRSTYITELKTPELKISNQTGIENVKYLSN